MHKFVFDEKTNNIRFSSDFLLKRLKQVYYQNKKSKENTDEYINEVEKIVENILAASFNIDFLSEKDYKEVCELLEINEYEEALMHLDFNKDENNEEKIYRIIQAMPKINTAMLKDFLKEMPLISIKMAIIKLTDQNRIKINSDFTLETYEKREQ